jgi:O-antigen/teichoic acid export membrane protein
LLQLYGAGYTNAYPYLLVFLVAAIPESLTIATSQVLQSKGKAWLYLVGINVPRDTTMLICAFFWVQRFGPIGLCYAYLTGRTLGVILVAVWTAYVGLDLDPHPAAIEKAQDLTSSTSRSA